MKTLETKEDAVELLRNIGTTDKLIKHVELVGEAGEQIIKKLEEKKIKIDKNYVRIGIILHDVGKILHPNELKEKGNKHEEAGEKLLLEKGVEPKYARCCRSHAQWNEMECSLEELLVALSDNLWKGSRKEALENLVINRLAVLLNCDYWDLFIEFDSFFEFVASFGLDRLSRS
jgi:putative nucleotidyltransferase with HDIG domain